MSIQKDIELYNQKEIKEIQNIINDLTNRDPNYSVVNTLTVFKTYDPSSIFIFKKVFENVKNENFYTLLNNSNVELIYIWIRSKRGIVAMRIMPIATNYTIVTNGETGEMFFNKIFDDVNKVYSHIEETITGGINNE